MALREVLATKYNNSTYPPVGQYNSYIDRVSNYVQMGVASSAIGGGLIVGGALISLIPVIGWGVGAAAITSGLAALGGTMMGGVAVVGGTVGGVVGAGAIGSSITKPISDKFKVDITKPDAGNIQRMYAQASSSITYPDDEYYDHVIVEHNGQTYVLDGQFSGRDLIDIHRATIIKV